jgi:hypothetical protein
MSPLRQRRVIVVPPADLGDVGGQFPRQCLALGAVRPARWPGVDGDAPTLWPVGAAGHVPARDATLPSKSMVAGVDIRQPVCVVFSVSQERERQAGAGDDELPAK